MEAVEFLKMSRELLKKMSKCDLKRDDYEHIEMFEEYARMRCRGDKVDYILRVLSEEYDISESTIKRIVKRLSGEVR